MELVASIPTQLSGASVSKPELAGYGGRVFVAWRESGAKDPPPFDIVRIAEIGSGGTLLNGPVDVASSGALRSRPTLAASELGLVLSWDEDGDPNAADTDLARSQIVVHHLGFDLAPIGPPVTVPSTRFQEYGPPHATALAVPRSVLVTWSARSLKKKGGLDATYVARLDCGL